MYDYNTLYINVNRINEISNFVKKAFFRTGSGNFEFYALYYFIAFYSGNIHTIRL